jgi:hypothetical protein
MLNFTEKEWKALEEQGNSKNSAKAIVHVFNPFGIGDWYLTEYDPKTNAFFGLCDLGYAELGYVDKEELFGMKIFEKDKFWEQIDVEELLIMIREGND